MIHIENVILGAPGGRAARAVPFLGQDYPTVATQTMGRAYEYADLAQNLRHRPDDWRVVLGPRSGRCRALCRVPRSRKPFRQYRRRARFEGPGGPDDMRQCGDARAHRRSSGGAPTQFPCAAVIATDQRAGTVAATRAMGKPMARGRAVGSMTPSGVRWASSRPCAETEAPAHRSLRPEKMGRLGLGFGFGCPASQLGLWSCPGAPGVHEAPEKQPQKDQHQAHSREGMREAARKHIVQ